jgi:hypothetical protein
MAFRTVQASGNSSCWFIVNVFNRPASLKSSMAARAITSTDPCRLPPPPYAAVPCCCSLLDQSTSTTSIPWKRMINMGLGFGIRDPGSRGQKDTRSRIPDPDLQNCKYDLTAPLTCCWNFLLTENLAFFLLIPVSSPLL